MHEFFTWKTVGGSASIVIGTVASAFSADSIMGLMAIALGIALWMSWAKQTLETRTRGLKVESLEKQLEEEIIEHGSSRRNLILARRRLAELGVQFDEFPKPKPHDETNPGQVPRTPPV